MSDGVILEDTIAAIATAPGEGGIAIVRVSGRSAPDVLHKVFRPRHAGRMRPAAMRYGHVVNGGGEVVDEALCVYFPAPRTYSGEDMCEIQCHGGLYQAKRVLSCVLESGARVAMPGEFTRRAYENGRIGLTEAEGVLSLIRANSELSARSALRQLSGSVSAFIAEVRGILTSGLALIEATIDFPDEVEEHGAAGKVHEAVGKALKLLDGAIDEDAARAVREGASVVIAGSPNVGKSSLLNAMLKRDRAIVSEIPGTTRDVLTETVRMDGLLIEMSDTAGQREADHPVEAIGIERAKAAQAEADLVFLLFDAKRGISEDDLIRIGEADERTVFVVNKSDIADAGAVAEMVGGAVCVSAVTGEGVEKLFEVMRERLSGYICAEPILVGLRQIECAKEARAALSRARAAMDAYPLDLVSTDIWAAMNAVGALAGEDVRENVIDRIFNDFCVGK